MISDGNKSLRKLKEGDMIEMERSGNIFKKGYNFNWDLIDSK